MLLAKLANVALSPASVVPIHHPGRRLPGDRAGWVAAPCGGFVGSRIEPVIVSFSISRFRVPSMMFPVAGCGALVVRGSADWRAVFPSRRGLPVLAVLALVGCIAMDFESVLRSTGS